MTKRSQFARHCRQSMLWATVALAITGVAMAQSTGTAKPAADEGGYSTWDITPYFGWQWFQAFQGDNSRNYTDKFQSGWIFGEKFDAAAEAVIDGIAALVSKLGQGSFQRQIRGCRHDVEAANVLIAALVLGSIGATSGDAAENDVLGACG